MRSLCNIFGITTNKKLLFEIRKLMVDVAEIQTKLDSANTKLDLVAGSVVSIGRDIANLHAKILELTEGAVTQEQINQLNTASTSISDRISSLASDLQSLDAQTPDTPEG